MAVIIALDEEKKPNEEETNDRWSNIVLDLVHLIASHAFPIDPGAIASIRATCKSWNAMPAISRPIPPPDDSNLRYQYPYLMTLSRGVCKFIHPFCSQYTFTKEFPQLSGAYVRFSKFGWLLLSRMDDSHFFFNPFTMQKIELPPCEGLQSMIFTCPPTSEHCRVLGVSSFDNEYCFFARGHLEWTSHYFSKGFYCKPCHPVYFNHKFYILGCKGNLAVLDDRKSFDYVRMMGDKFLVRDHDLHRCFLAQNGGELLAVCMGEEEQDICIRAMNPLKSLWRKVDKLPGKTVYGSRSTSFVKQAPVRSMGNKIYFPKIQQESCVPYSLATHNYQSFLGDYSSKSPWGLKEFVNCAWIDQLMPFEPRNPRELLW